MKKSISVYIAFLLLLAVTCIPIALVIIKIVNTARAAIEQNFAFR